MKLIETVVGSSVFLASVIPRSLILCQCRKSAQSSAHLIRFLSPFSGAAMDGHLRNRSAPIEKRQFLILCQCPSGTSAVRPVKALSLRHTLPGFPPFSGAAMDGHLRNRSAPIEKRQFCLVYVSLDISPPLSPSPYRGAIIVNSLSNHDLLETRNRSRLLHLRYRIDGIPAPQKLLPALPASEPWVLPLRNNSL